MDRESGRQDVALKLINFPRCDFAASSGNSYGLHHCCWHITPPSWQDGCCDVGLSIAARIVGSGHASISPASVKLPNSALGPEVVSSILETVSQDEVLAGAIYYQQI